MKPKEVMVIAGEASGDLLAAELIRALRNKLVQAQASPSPDLQPLTATLEPRFFGAGGPRMGEAGVELAFDMTAHAVVGLVEVLKNYRKFRGFLHQLLHLAIEREPEAIICVDFSGFNRRFAHAIKKHVRARRGPFQNWNPKLIQYVSPQVWASREGRAREMARDFDLLLSIFPFEKEWYAKHAFEMRVEYVGHPMMDRYAGQKWPASLHAAIGCSERGERQETARGVPPEDVAAARELGTVPPTRLIALLPGSRFGELKRHLPVLCETAHRISARQAVQFRIVLPTQQLADEAAKLKWPAHSTIQVGGLPESLCEASVAIASTGTVTMECAYFGVPTVALYKTSWSTYQIGKRIIQVNFLAMPNLLAGDAIYPEFIQQAATPQNLARAALEFLENPSRAAAVRLKLAKVVRMLGGPGASQRAAEAICQIMTQPPMSNN